MFKRGKGFRLSSAKAFLLVFNLVCFASVYAAEERLAEKTLTTPDAGGVPEIYPLVKLTSRADWIVVGSVKEQKDELGRHELTLSKVIKRAFVPKKPPEFDKEYLTRARDLLDGKTVEPEGRPDDNQAAPIADEKSGNKLDAPRLFVRAEKNLQIPAGEKLFFLWERDPATRSVENDATLSFLLNHPQAVYEADLAPQAQNALIAPLRISPERWLRATDGVLATRFRRLAAAMRNAETVGGAPVQGLALEIGDLKPALGGDNSFFVACKIRNVRPYPQYVYSGFRGGLGVRLRPVLTEQERSEADSAARPRRTVFLFPADEERESQWGLEDAALETADDFTALAENESLVHDMQIAAEKRPELGALKGLWSASVFYWSERTGERAANLPRRAWTGIVFSKELPLRFGARGSEPEKR